MGKKIPGKKHKGIKDPLLQNAKKEESLKNKINAPPKEVDCQEVPKSIERIIKLKQMAKSSMFNKRKKKTRKSNNLLDTSKFINKEKILPGMSKPDRNIPSLVQRPGESDYSFLNRLSRVTHDFIKEVNFEVKNNMKMKRDEKTGEVTFDKIEIDPVEKMFQDACEREQKPKFKHKKFIVDNLSKTARRRLKLKAKKEMLKGIHGEPGEDDEFKKLQDNVAFNEVVHRPPQITALPRKAVTLDEARRPGSKPGLLLTQFFSDGEGVSRKLTGRRRVLSASDRRHLESAQSDAILAYRKMKAARETRFAVK